MRLVHQNDEIVNRLVDRRPACASRNIYRSGDYDIFILLGFLATLGVVLILFLQYDFTESQMGKKTTSASSTANGSSTDHSTDHASVTTTAGTQRMVKRLERRLAPDATGNVRIGTSRSTRRSIRRGTGKRASSSTKRATPRQRTAHSVKYCEGAGCLKISQTITDSVDPKLNPCSDFYHFVCKTWLNHTKLTLGEAKLSEDDIKKREIEKVLVAELKAGTDDASLKWPYRLWEACRAGKGEPGADHMFVNILKAHGIKDFPYRKDSGLNISRTAAKLLKLSDIAAIVGVSVQKAPEGFKEKFVIRIDPPRTIFRGFVKMRDIHDEWYLAAVERISDTRYLPKLLKLEQALVDLAGERREAKNYIKSKVNLLLKSKHWDWTVFLGTLFKGVTKIYYDTEVLIKGGSFQKRLITIINSFGAATILNYLTFRMHIQYALFLNFDDYLEIATIAGASVPGWEDGDQVRDAADFRCVRILSRVMPELYAYIYWKARLRNRHQLSTAVEALTEHSLNEVISVAEQLNVASKMVKRFRDDLFGLQKQLFVPDWVQRQRSRMQFAKMLFVDTEDSLLMSWNGILTARQRNMQKKLTDAGFETFWHGDFLSPEPWIDFDEKVLHVPAPAVQSNFTADAFMVHHVPRLGLNIARTVMRHLVDRTFQQRAQVPSTHLKVEFLKDCLRKQYYHDRPSNDMASHGDLLDLLTLPAALRVFQKHATRGSPIFKLRSVPQYAGDQLFFIEFALGRCEKYDDSYFHQRLHHGFSSPAAFRVNGPLKNMPEFAKAFRCPPDSDMVAKHRCGFLSTTAKSKDGRKA
ncbi:neprilysin-2-like [Ornithodoros turicata]|uniref:neprilysin-2-like n=1 Tax=Ornithodoros turicata TaxID=34597 RepID=UPI003138C0B6